MDVGCLSATILVTELSKLASSNSSPEKTVTTVSHSKLSSHSRKRCWCMKKMLVQGDVSSSHKKLLLKTCKSHAKKFKIKELKGTRKCIAYERKKLTF